MDKTAIITERANFILCVLNRTFKRQLIGIDKKDNILYRLGFISFSSKNIIVTYGKIKVLNIRNMINRRLLLRILC